ncbi:syndecan isoform X4 [Drosophila mojavensis]|uniref:syndecan isoform X4 n=1 Tax=Drosophila mojavensis TaxID=7230 RepID=UPI001CD161A2|nr:syndecan isoform X4 [Drosophila mojavensis]
MKSKLKTAQSMLTSKSPSPMPSNGKWMLVSAMLLVLLAAATQAADEKTVKASIAAPASSVGRQTEEIYIDDDGSEGSGGRGGIHDDLEKETDYSGSGFGPDDEDAITDHHSSSHNTRLQNAGNSNTHTPTTQTTTISTTTTTISTSTTTNPPQLNNTATEQQSKSVDNTSSTIATTNTTLATPSSTFNQSTPQLPLLPDAEDEDDAFDHEDTLQGSGDDNDDDEDGDDDDDDDDDNGDDADDKDDQLIDPHPESEITQTHHTHVETSNGRNDNDGDGDGHIIDLDENVDEDDGLYTEISVNKDVTHPAGGSGGSSGSTNVHELDPNTNINSQPTDTKISEHRPGGSGDIVIMSEEDRTTSFFAQPGILAAVIGGAVVGLLCAILVVMFIVYRMRKKDEGSYALDEPKRSPANNSYAKNANNREFYA